MLIAALAQGESLLRSLLDCDDTQHMHHCCQQLGVRMQQESLGLRVWGNQGRFHPSAEPLYVENAGTCARFLTAALCLTPERFVLTGNARMSERPMGDLIEALRSLGAKLEAQGRPNSLPLVIHGVEGLKGGEVQVSGQRSSQFITALMLMAPYLKTDLRIIVTDDFVSKPYCELTRHIMQDFGVEVAHPNPREFFIPSGQCYQGRDYQIEGDASSASYFFALAAICAAKITVHGIRSDSHQGDLQFLNILETMGCQIERTSQSISVQGPEQLRSVNVDMKDISDVFPTMAIVALFADAPVRIDGVEHIRLKESDRISAMARELSKIGAQVDEYPGGVCISAQKPLQGASIDTYQDHRIAMAFGVLACKVPNIVIENKSCVSKTYPNFFSDLKIQNAY